MCLPQGLLFPDWAAGTIPSSLVVTEGALAAAWNWLWRDSYYGWATRVIDAGHLSWVLCLPPVLCWERWKQADPAA